MSLLSLVDRRFPKLAYADLDSWAQLAGAGDATAQYRLGRSLLDAGIHTNLAQARTWLWAAAKQGFAPAHYLLGRLATEDLIPGARPGASLWWNAKAIASWARSGRGALLPLRERMLPHARGAKHLRIGERTKLRYMGAWNRPGTCAVEIGRMHDGRLAVMLQTLPKCNTGTSVTNMVVNVAFRALVEVLLDGYDPHPQDIAWFEVWPKTEWTEGRVHALALAWDAHAERYRDPAWGHVDPGELPFDVAHAVLLEPEFEPAFEPTLEREAS